MRQDDHPTRDLPTPELFWEYLDLREQGAAVDVERLLDRAGSDRAELERRIRVYETLHSIGSESDVPVPERIGRFRIERLLERGGLGRVYLAHDPRLDRQVAIKVLGESALLGSQRRLLVVNEARSMAHLDHPGVVRIHEVDRDGALDYLVLDYVPGPSLRDVLDELRVLHSQARDPDAPERSADPVVRRIADSLREVDARLACIERIADALAYCHRQGVLHRDIKPGNILFDSADQPVLIDFGLAHLAKAAEDAKAGLTGRLVGTAAYVAPEQAEFGRIGTDPRSEVFSFGTLAYEVLTLWNPFERSKRTQTLDAVARANPRRPRQVEPAIGAGAENVILRCLERRPDDRYASLQALSADVRAVLEGCPAAVNRGRRARRARSWVAKHHVLVGTALAVLVLLSAGYVASNGRQEVHAESDAAEGYAFASDALVELGLAYSDAVSFRGPKPFDVLDLPDGGSLSKPSRALIEWALVESEGEDPFPSLTPESRGKLLDILRNSPDEVERLRDVVVHRD
jgi:serine/threonine protein kinase